MTIGVLVSFLLDWLAVAFDWRKIKPMTKVLAMAMVIIWTLAWIGWPPEALLMLLLLAQMFGLNGDICLLFSDQLFFVGLGSFLIGHLFYSALIIYDVFSSRNLVSNGSFIILAISITALFWGAILFIVYRIFKRDHFLRRRKGKLLWSLVQVYTWVLSGFTALTVFRMLVNPVFNLKMVLLPVGGVLFLISDMILAYDRFQRPVRKGQLWVHMTYHLAQFSLAFGFLTYLGQN